MVKVHAQRDAQGRLTSLSACGHAGWADSGSDVVCAAVSAILQAAWLGLEEYVRADVTAEKREGRLDLRWPAATRDDPAARSVLETATLAIQRIASQYPSHVEVTVETERDG